jgi:hypothetical protein
MHAPQLASSRIFNRSVTFRSQPRPIVTGIEPLQKVTALFWKIFSLQRMLDSLFDEAWCQLGLPDVFERLDNLVEELPSIG